MGMEMETSRCIENLVRVCLSQVKSRHSAKVKVKDDNAVAGGFI